MIAQRFGLGNVDWQQRINWDELRKKRIDRANQFMDKYGIGAAIVYNWDRKRYLTSLWNHPYSRGLNWNFALLIRDAGFPYVEAMTVDRARVAEDCPWLEGRLMDHDQLLQPRPGRYQAREVAANQWSTTAKQIKGLLEKHGVADMPLSIDSCSPNFMDALRGEGLTVVDGNAWIDECGMIKFDEEIVCMKTAAAINEAGYGAVFHEARVGMKEYEIQGIMAKAIYSAGGEYIEGWVVNSGDRTNPRSFNWSDRILRPREFLSLEACHVNWCGYKVCYDRTFMVGAKPSSLQKEVYQTVVEMHERFQELLKPGVTTQEIARWRPKPGENFKTKEQIAEWRASWSNHFGGMGCAWDSAPNWRSEADVDVELQKNMTITYHAILSAEGEAGGVAIENTYLITDKGCEALTKWPYEDIMILGL